MVLPQHGVHPSICLKVHQVAPPGKYKGTPVLAPEDPAFCSKMYELWPPQVTRKALPDPVAQAPET